MQYTIRIGILALILAGFACTGEDESTRSGGEPPDTPTGLQATAGPGEVKLVWRAVDSVFAYKVYRGEQPGGPYTELATTAALAYTDGYVEAGTTYYYVVRAVNAGGTSLSSNEASATPGADADDDGQPPAGPNNLTATVRSSSQVDLKWTDNADNETGYRLERRRIANSYIMAGMMGDDSESYPDSGLQPDTKYFYRVVAYNLHGFSSFSNEVSVRTKPSCYAPGESCPTNTRQSAGNCEYTGSDATTTILLAEDFQSFRALSSVMIRVLDNAGTPTGICAVTGEAGTVSMKVPLNVDFAYAVSSVGSHDTYHFNRHYASAVTNDTVSAVSQVTWQLIAGIIGVEQSSEKGMLWGGVYNQNGTLFGDTMGTVEVFAGADEVYYFSDEGLPSDHTSVDALNPAFPEYIGLNAATGPVEITLSYDSAASTATDNTGVVYPNSATIIDPVCADCTR